MVEFINLRQGCTSLHDYSIEFIQLPKYAPSFVSNPRDEMSRFVTGVSDDLQEECHSAMLRDNMHIYRLMVHAKHVEKARSRWKCRDAKGAISFHGISLMNSLEIQEKPRVKKKVSSQVSSKLPKASGDRVSNTTFKKGRGTN